MSPQQKVILVLVLNVGRSIERCLKMEIRSNYVKEGGKWVRKMEFFDDFGRWKEFNDMDFHHLSKLVNAS